MLTYEYDISVYWFCSFSLVVLKRACLLSQKFLSISQIRDGRLAPKLLQLSAKVMLVLLKLSVIFTVMQLKTEILDHRLKIFCKKMEEFEFNIMLHLWTHWLDSCIRILMSLWTCSLVACRLIKNEKIVSYPLYPVALLSRLTSKSTHNRDEWIYLNLSLGESSSGRQGIILWNVFSQCVQRWTLGLTSPYGGTTLQGVTGSDWEIHFIMLQWWDYH